MLIGSHCICSQWAYCFTFKCLVSIYLSILQHTFRVPLKPSTFPSSTCIDLLQVIIYTICAAAVCLKCSQYCITVCIGSSKFLYFAAAAIIYNYSNNQQQEQLSSRSIPPRPNTLTFSCTLPCRNLLRVVMIEIHYYCTILYCNIIGEA